MPGMVLQKENEPSWIRYAKQRTRQNKNFLCFISGPTGSGKSYSCLRIGELLDPEFDVNRVVFGGLELMRLIESGKLHKGSVIVWEELGVSASNRNWQSATNKLLSFLMQTFRHRCFVLLMNAPYMDFADAALRRLFHAELRTVSIDYAEEKVLLRPQLIQYNGRLQKFYYKYLRLITPNGVVPVVSWKVGKPSASLVEAYEKRKLDFTNALNAEITRELERQEAKKQPKALTELQQAAVEAFREGLTQLEVAERLGVSVRMVQQHMRLAKKKEYAFKLKEGGTYEVYPPG